MRCCTRTRIGSERSQSIATRLVFSTDHSFDCDSDLQGVYPVVIVSVPVGIGPESDTRLIPVHSAQGHVGTYSDSSGSGSGSFAFAGRCGVGGGSAFAPLRVNLLMDLKPWDNGLLDPFFWLDPPASDPAPDHPRGRSKHAPPNTGLVPGQGTMMACASSDAPSIWTSPGQHHQRPTTFEDLAQAQANAPIVGHLNNQNTQWHPPVFHTAGPPRTAQHQQSLNGLLDAIYSAPNYPPSLLAPTPMPQRIFTGSRSVQPLQGGYETSAADSSFPFQPQVGDQWAGPSFSHEFVSTITALDPGSLPAHMLNTTIDVRDGTHLVSLESGPTSPPESYFALSPTSAVSRDRRGSTASTELTVPDGPPDPLPPSPLGQRKHAKVPSATKFEFVIENIGRDGTRKRAAEEPPASATSQTLSNVSLAGKNGEPQGAMITFGHRQKKRAAFSEEKKKQTKEVRKKGVCARCKRAKKACDLALKKSPYEPCDLCGSTDLYKGVSRMPCFQSNLEELGFFRRAPAENEPLHAKRPDIYHLGEISKDNALIKNVKLTQGIGNHYLIVYASEFEPKNGEVLVYKWRDSQDETHVMDMPPYSVAAINKVKGHFERYIEATKQSYLKSIKDEDVLAWKTASFAMAYAKARPGSLVELALDLWAVCRMIEIPWTICGEETLGIERVTDEQNPHYGKVPIPPTMDTQLDQIAIRYILTPLRTKLIKKFDEVIRPPSPEAWLETYLASFILLNHIEQLAKHSVSHAKLHTLPGKYSNIPFLEGALHWAKIILSRFHFVCNGAAPLRMDWTNPDVAKMAKLDKEQVEFMVDTQSLVRARRPDIVAIRKAHKYEDPLFWSSQLFEEEWDKSPAHVVEE